MTTATRHFIRHYVEMVVAMFLGMAVLGMPALLALGAAGVSSTELRSDAPALLLLGMGLTMTVPMVAWMRYRGHGWRASNEMAASMLIPTAGVIALLMAGRRHGHSAHDSARRDAAEHARRNAAAPAGVLARRSPPSPGRARWRGVTENLMVGAPTHRATQARASAPTLAPLANTTSRSSSAGTPATWAIIRPRYTRRDSSTTRAGSGGSPRPSPPTSPGARGP